MNDLKIIKYNEYNEKLFFKVWRNIYLLKNIFQQIEYYRLVYKFSSTSRFQFNSISLSKYKYREYLLTIHLNTKSQNFDINPLTASEEIDYSTGRFKKPKETIISNDVIQATMIPESVENVIVHTSSIIDIGTFGGGGDDSRCNVKFLKFTAQCKFPDGIPKGLIPSSVINLEIHSNKISKKPIYIPQNVRSLSFYWLNQPLTIPIPNSVEQLSLGVTFNQKLSTDTFTEDSNLQTIEFGFDFNQPIQFGVLSHLKKLTTIKFGHSFQQPIIPFSIPDQVTSIIFRGNYNIPFEENSLPKSVKLIHLNNTSNNLNNL